jgi:IclR family transcriptional regulator, acetate operon repressor
VTRSNDGAGPRRVLRLIEAVARFSEPARLADLAASAELSKPTAHRLLGILADEDWVVAHEGGRYAIGPAARAVSAMVASANTQEGIGSVLADLQRRVGQTVHLGVRSGDRFVYVHKVEGGEQPFQMASRVGGEQSLHCTAIGKCILTDLDDAELAAFVERAGLEGRTSHTISSLDALVKDLDQIRARGYAIDEEENEANIRCIAAPIRRADGRVTAAVSISTVAFLVGRDELLAMSDDLVSATK